MNQHRLAAIQMTSSDDVTANLGDAEELLEIAASEGAELVVLPENFAFMGKRESDKLGICEAYGSGPIQDFLSRQASLRKIWLVGGTIPLESTRPDKVRAACLFFSPEGRVVTRYDKMHLFDVTVDGIAQEHYLESESIEAGSDVAVAETPFGLMGLAVCYDLRFPELFRVMVAREAEVLALPSAFTATTGRAHWEILIRARAIENQCYVAAAAQGGRHANGRETYGHTMIVDPWGKVLARQPTGRGVVIHDMDRDLTTRLRRDFPVLRHIRLTTNK